MNRDEPFDSTVCENATLEDLDVDAIKWLRGVIGLHDPARADPEKGPAEFLSDFGLLRRDRLTHAAALFFGLPRLIAHLKPGGIVDFRLYYGSRRTESNTRWDDRELCDGHVVGALRALLERFHRLSPQPFEMEPNGVQHRAESRDYLAVREAFVNLLVHQDYTDRHRTARILWYRDRVLFENPGDSFLSPEEMLEGGISDPRNPLLVQLMRQAGYAEQAGRGIRGIIETWRRAGRESPEIINERGRKRYRLELPWQEHPITEGKGGTEGVEPKFEAARPMARSADRTKTTTSKGRWDRDRLPELRLDRDRQKTEVYRKLAELVRSDTRRVLALVAYAAAGNAIAALWEQLRHQLDFELYADIAWLRLDFPADRSQLRRELEHELRRKLDATADESVAQLLRRHAPRSEDSGRATILWLNWGVFGPGNEHQEPLNSEQLGEWLRFSSQFLGTHCPDDLRVVSYLAFEVQESRQGRLQQTLQEHRRQPWCRTPAFQLKVLPPLGRVSDDDLLDFLEDPASSSCDPGIQAEIAQRVVVETGGEFEPTAALLQEAERGSWYDLLARLRREQGGEFSDDEPF
ncbi:MAG: hypothetical protein GY856_07760 [bacterium]|nr:hypothetical protein [bacterium]